MQDLNDLYYYAQVVEHGGFAPAGRALGIAKSRLSRRIAELESRLGVRLLQRSTRRFSVTDVGQIYYQHCRAMLIEADHSAPAADVSPVPESRTPDQSRGMVAARPTRCRRHASSRTT